MNKNLIRREIAGLIDSIKEHSDEIGTQKRIPQLELELMLNKIKKLYEKAIIYNHLNSVENSQQDSSVSKTGTSVSTPVQVVEPIKVSEVEPEIIAPHTPDPVNEPVVEPPVTPSKPEVPYISQPVKSDSSQVPKSLIKEIRQGIGINEKIMFIKQLFKGDSITYENVISELEAAGSIQAAQQVLDRYSVQYMWGADNPSYHVLQQLIKRRYSA